MTNQSTTATVTRIDNLSRVKAHYVQRFHGQKIECILLDNDHNRSATKLFDPARETLESATAKFSAFFS